MRFFTIKITLMAIKKFKKPPALIKTDISSKIYDKLIQLFEPSNIKSINYYYLDTNLNKDKAKLFAQKIRLRIRSKGRKYSLELKDKSVVPRKEIIQFIDIKDFNQILQPNGILMPGEISSYIKELATEPLCLVRTVTTLRAKRHFFNGILVLEKNLTAGQIVWQLEFRSEEHFTPEEIERFLARLKCCQNVYIPKLIRVWDRKNLIKAIA